MPWQPQRRHCIRAVASQALQAPCCIQPQPSASPSLLHGCHAGSSSFSPQQRAGLLKGLEGRVARQGLRRHACPQCRHQLLLCSCLKVSHGRGNGSCLLSPPPLLLVLLQLLLLLLTQGPTSRQAGWPVLRRLCSLPLLLLLLLSSAQLAGPTGWRLAFLLLLVILLLLQLLLLLLQGLQDGGPWSLYSICRRPNCLTPLATPIHLSGSLPPLAPATLAPGCRRGLCPMLLLLLPLLLLLLPPLLFLLRLPLRILSLALPMLLL